MALKLGEFNNLRKKIEKEVESKALEMVEDNDKIICVSYPGVIGIVASRLVEQFNRPSIVISEEEKLCKNDLRDFFKEQKIENYYKLGSKLVEFDAPHI